MIGDGGGGGVGGEAAEQLTSAGEAEDEATAAQGCCHVGGAVGAALEPATAATAAKAATAQHSTAGFEPEASEACAAAAVMAQEPDAAAAASAAVKPAPAAAATTVTEPAVSSALLEEVRVLRRELCEQREHSYRLDVQRRLAQADAAEEVRAEMEGLMDALRQEVLTTVHAGLGELFLRVSALELEQDAEEESVDEEQDDASVLDLLEQQPGLAGIDVGHDHSAVTDELSAYTSYEI